MAVDHDAVQAATGGTGRGGNFKHAALGDRGTRSHRGRAAIAAERGGADRADGLGHGHCVQRERGAGIPGVKVEREQARVNRDLDTGMVRFNRGLEPLQQSDQTFARQTDHGTRLAAGTGDVNRKGLARRDRVAEHNGVALRDTGAGSGRGRGCHRRDAAASALGCGLGHGATFGRGRERVGCARDHAYFDLGPGALIPGKSKNFWCKGGDAGGGDDGHGITVQVRRTLVVSIRDNRRYQHARGVHIDVLNRQSLPFKNIGNGLHNDGTVQFLGTRQHGGFDQVDVERAAGAHFDVLAADVGQVAHLAGVDVAAGLDLDRAAVGHHRINDETGRFVNADITQQGGGHRNAGHQCVELHALGGGHVQMVGNENRSAIGDYFGRTDRDVATGGAVGADDATLHCQRATHFNTDVGRRIKGHQTANKATQGEVGADVNGDVALRAQREVAGRQCRRLDIDVTRSSVLRRKEAQFLRASASRDTDRAAAHAGRIAQGIDFDCQCGGHGCRGVGSNREHDCALLHTAGFKQHTIRFARNNRDARQVNGA